MCMAPLQVLFCGHMMRAGFEFTRQAVERAGLASTLLVQQCSTEELPAAVRDAHVAVPLMSAFDKQLLQHARQLQMILQFGVGLEAVDVPAVRPSCQLLATCWCRTCVTRAAAKVCRGAHGRRRSDASSVLAATAHVVTLPNCRAPCCRCACAAITKPACARSQASELGIIVSNIPSTGTGNAAACAEHAILLTLALLRDLRGCERAVSSRRLGEPCGDTLLGKHVLVLGFGGIAKELVPRLQPFQVRVSCVRRSRWQGEVWRTRRLASGYQEGWAMRGEHKALHKAACPAPKHPALLPTSASLS